MNYALYNMIFYVMLLLPLAVTASFPMGRCYSSSCEATPYDIAWTSETALGNDMVSACFTVTSKPCIDTTGLNCCQSFATQLHKIKLSTNQNCITSLVNVTVNGTRKGGGVYIEADVGQQAELTLTTLRIPGDKAVNTKFCLTLKPPCNSIESYCVDDRSGLCKFAMYNDPNHVCCATCIMLNLIQAPSASTQDQEYCEECCRMCSCNQ